MKNLISRTITYISSLLSRLQVNRFLAVVLVGSLLLTTNVAFGSQSNKDLGEKVREQIQQNDSQRPKTTGEWYQEARETENSPGERLKRIGEESAEAFKEFGSGYVEGTQETARGIKDSAAQAGEALSN
ncbi:hypothetical protein VB735_29730 [Halotia wernerae UHCC 0503]|nr:hypothetical protein [Halotia wernerae UHCC 0503]